MPLPNLIHPIQVTVEQIDRSTTIYDPDAREPIGAAARKTTVTMPGQPRWASQRQLEAQAFGPTDSVRGYILFRYVDLTAYGVDLAIGDRVTAQGHLTAPEGYVVRLEPQAHYQDQNGASTVKAWLSDRLPAKER